MKLKITTALLAVLCIGWFSGFAATETSKPVDRIKDLADANFEVGAKLGYSVAAKGGTRKDLEMIIQAKKDNQPEKVDAWFQSR